MPRKKNLYKDPYLSLLSSMSKADYEERLEILKRFRLDLDWHTKEYRLELIARLPGLYKKLQGPVPKLPAVFDNGELEQLLFDATDNWADNPISQIILPFVSLVVESGYRYEPEYDDEGRPCAEHATPLHLLVLHSSHFTRCWFDLSNELFRIYERHGVNYRDEHGLTHLHVASHFGYDCRVHGYLELGADPNCRDRKTGNAPLHLALANSLKSTVELLLRYGADPGMANAKGATPLHVLGQVHNRANLAEMLNKLSDRKYGPVRVDARDNEGNSPLHLAVGSDNNNMMVYLLRQGANPNLANNRRLTPLHLACQKNGGDVLKLLFQTIDELQQEPAPLQKGQRSARRRRRVDGVVYREANVNARDESGRTPLQLAVANCLPQAVDLLLEHGADLADFAFPTSDYFGAWFEPIMSLRMASGALASCECLEKAGYTVERDDALTIMKFFDRCGMFARKVILDRRWYDYDEQLRTRAKKIKSKQLPDGMTLEDLMMLPFELADQRMEYGHYYSLSQQGNYFDICKRSPCNEYLCEQLARGFFRRWALHPFMELIHDRLPQLCCEMILEHLTNRDLCNLCLAVAGESPVTRLRGEREPPPRQEEEARSEPPPPVKKRRSKKLKT
ncbi:hypothetical protein TKK_0017818 [Trichogramma kaykai]|uniref:Uncharacterized protein n=1 Tax=Trichogramma kaykai TaxID=54128 RepID=A0ABD2W252_9HYME